MTDTLRTAAQQALGALEVAALWVERTDEAIAVSQAIESLRTALAQQGEQPVAYRQWIESNPKLRGRWMLATPEVKDRCRPQGKWEPLYAAAPAPVAQRVEALVMPNDDAIFEALIQCSDVDGVAYDAQSFEAGYRRGKVDALDDAEPMIEVADRYAHRLALELECVLADRHGYYNTAMQVLGEYREAMNAIHEQHSPTFMGEPLLPKGRP